MFPNESSMQSWMKNVIESEGSIGKILLPLHSISRNSVKNDAICRSYRDAINALVDPEIIVENNNISSREGYILRPDFVLKSDVSGCLFIVELKNSSSATRQAGTEISAYSATIQETNSLMPQGNIITIIVSTEWPPPLTFKRT